MFAGTGAAVKSLPDYLESGDTLNEFLTQFPSVKREQAIAALELARDTVLAALHDLGPGRVHHVGA